MCSRWGQCVLPLCGQVGPSWDSHSNHGGRVNWAREPAPAATGVHWMVCLWWKQVEPTFSPLRSLRSHNGRSVRVTVTLQPGFPGRPGQSRWLRTVVSSFLVPPHVLVVPLDTNCVIKHKFRDKLLHFLKMVTRSIKSQTWEPAGWWDACACDGWWPMKQAPAYGPFLSKVFKFWKLHVNLQLLWGPFSKSAQILDKSVCVPRGI